MRFCRALSAGHFRFQIRDGRTVVLDVILQHRDGGFRASHFFGDGPDLRIRALDFDVQPFDAAADIGGVPVDFVHLGSGAVVVRLRGFDVAQRAAHAVFGLAQRIGPKRHFQGFPLGGQL